MQHPMNLINQKRGRLDLLEALTRKASSLFSLAHSAVAVLQDGVNPRSMKYRERLYYLQLQKALNWKKDLVVYDIGANIGSFATLVAKLPSVSTVYCFEPLPYVFADLKKRTETFGKIRCFQVGLADRSGTILMNSNESSPSSSMLPLGALHATEFPLAKKTHTVEVQITTMSEAVLRYGLATPDFIKADVQGFEDRVIRSGLEVVRKAKYCMLELSLVSLYQDSVLITPMNEFMRSLGFRLVNIVHHIIGVSGEIVQIDGLFENNDIQG